MRFQFFSHQSLIISINYQQIKAQPMANFNLDIIHNHIIHKSIQRMGGSQSDIRYAVPISDKVEGESAIYRFPDFKDKLIDRPQKDIATMKDALLYACKQFADRNSLGKIVRVEQDQHIDYITYKQLLNQAQQIGSGIIHEGLFNTPEGQKFKFIGIFSKNRPEWTVVDVAANLYGLTTIPIYDTLGDENITYVFKHVQLTTCFVNQGGIKALMKTHDLDKIKTLVSFDKFTEEQVQYFADKGIKLLNYSDIVNIGKANLVDYKDQKYKILPDDCITFSYTSGTTGPPKGAMISHKNFTAFIAATVCNIDCHFGPEDVALSYLPLPHILEREFLYSIIYGGGSIVYYSGDVQKIKDDLALVKPTIFLSVPRLFSRFYDVIKAKFHDVSGFGKMILDRALSVKMENVTTNGGVTHRIYDPLVFNKTKEALGGRVRLMVSGSAPLLPDVHSFMKICMGCPLIQGYGQTESTGAAFITDGRDNVVGHVGGSISDFQYKLVDIPEMNYLSTDKDEQGRPTPRGEIWVRGPGVFLGYYHDEEKTKEAITPDGWLKTGDVGAQLPITKGLKIVDRKKNIFKLQQGQYVAAEKVQNAYLKCQALAQIFIHGDSTESYIIGIVVPHKKFLMELAEKLKVEGTYEQVCKNLAIRTQITAMLNKVGKDVKLAGFEQVKNVYIEPEPFMTRGICTNTMKIQRHEARKFYKAQIADLYKEGMLKIDKKEK